MGRREELEGGRYGLSLAPRRSKGLTAKVVADLGFWARRRASA